MAPAKFQIYVDDSIRQPATGGGGNVPATNLGTDKNVADVRNANHPTITTASSHQHANILDQDMDEKPARYIPEVLPPRCCYYFDERKIYPITGNEYCFEEINLKIWNKKREEFLFKRRFLELQRENEELRERVEAQENQISTLQLQLQAQTISSSAPNSQPSSQPLQFSQNQQPMHHQNPGRLSIIPQSLQPAQGMELYGANNELPSVVHDWDTTLMPDVTKNTMAYDVTKNTLMHDKFTLPVDQSQYIREHVPTSTPASKQDDEHRRAMFHGNRRMSRPSMGGGSPTLKLSPINETSRECNSKSSSSSSASSATPGTITRVPLVSPPDLFDEPDRPLDPNDPTTYTRLLNLLSDPLGKRSGFIRLNRMAPKIRQGACFQAGDDNYLVDKELSQEAKTYTAQLLNDDSNESGDIQIKNICFRFDQPANDWLYYICNELNRRLIKQSTKPDIELSVMIANPAIVYNDASILIDEYFRFVTLQDFVEACITLNKPFPKSMAAYITLELIQIIRQIHSSDIIHMNINTKNTLITCCPTREDIENVHEKTSIVKLIGFDRAMDTRLLPPNFKFELELKDLVTCQMMDSKPWTHEVDWFGLLGCVHRMFFLEDMSVSKNENGRWEVGKLFKGYPTDVWSKLFDDLLNLDDSCNATNIVDQAIDELNTWVKANISFVLKEADALDRVLEEHCRAINKSVRI